MKAQNLTNTTASVGCNPATDQTILLSPAQHQSANSPSPPQSTLPCRPTLNNTVTGQRGVAARHGKMKKTAIDHFNNSCQEETHHLNLKRKMEHDEKWH